MQNIWKYINKLSWKVLPDVLVKIKEYLEMIRGEGETDGLSRFLRTASESESCSSWLAI